MANINVKLKNATGDILYPQTEWNNIQNKPSLHLTTFHNIGELGEGDNEFIIFWIGQSNHIGYDITQINFPCILSVCVRNVTSSTTIYNYLELDRITRLDNGQLNLFLTDNNSSSSAQISVELTSDKILADEVFDLTTH